MADNKTASAGSGGATFVTAQGSWSGDTADLPGSFSIIASGSEGSWTFSTVVGNSGNLAAGVQRVCIATDDVNLSAIKTAVETIDNVVKAEDAVHGSGDSGIMALAVRSDTATATGADGDYVPLLTDSAGKLHVNVGNTVTVASHAVTNAGTFAVQVDGSALTALQLIDDPVFADDAAFTLTSSKVMVAGAVRDDSLASLTAVEGDAVPLRVDANGAQWVVVNGTVTVGSHAVTNAGTFAVQVDGSALTALQLIDNIVHVDDAAFTLGTHSGAMMMGFAGTQSVDANDACALACTTAGALFVSDAGGSLTVDNTVLTDFERTQGGVAFCMVGGRRNDALSLADGDNSYISLTSTGAVLVADVGGSLTALQIMDDWDNAASDGASVSGDVAHDAADAGEPVKLGAKAETSLSGITLVADGDRTNLYAGVDGVLIVREHCNLEDVVQERTTNTDGASTAFASGLAAPGANVRLWITSVDICNSSASFCTVDLRDGSAGSVLWTLPVPATGGVVKTFNPPLKLTANTALAFDASAATSTITISANGFKSKV